MILNLLYSRCTKFENEIAEIRTSNDLERIDTLKLPEIPDTISNTLHVFTAAKNIDSGRVSAAIYAYHMLQDVISYFREIDAKDIILEGIVERSINGVSGGGFEESDIEQNYEDYIRLFKDTCNIFIEIIKDAWIYGTINDLATDGQTVK